MPATTTNKPVRLVLHTGGQDEAYEHQARFKVVVAGRRWGKTELALAQLLSACLRTNGVYRYIAPTQKLARKTLWRRKIPRVIDPRWLSKPPNETNMEVWFRSGSILEVLGADDPDALRGEGVNGVVLDEYADMKEETWPEAVRPSLGDKKGWALFIGTPKSYNHFYHMYMRGQSKEFPKWQSWKFKSVNNPLLDPEEIEDARRTTDPRSFRQEWEASFETIAGRAYYAFSRERHVAPVALDPAAPVAVSFDFNINPAVVVIGQAFQDQARILHEVYMPHMGGEATRASAQAAFDWLKSKNWGGEIRIYGDPAGQSGKTTGPSDHAVVREVFRNATWCIRPHAPHVKDRVAAVNARCETMDGSYHLLVNPSCERVIDDFEQVVFGDDGDLDKKTNPMLTHISDAAGYWIHAVWPVKHVTQSVGRSMIERLL